MKGGENEPSCLPRSLRNNTLPLSKWVADYIILRDTDYIILS